MLLSCFSLHLLIFFYLFQQRDSARVGDWYTAMKKRGRIGDIVSRALREWRRFVGRQPTWNSDSYCGLSSSRESPPELGTGIKL